jgi:tetratricopeptide (TPR) repeat protein
MRELVAAPVTSRVAEVWVPDDPRSSGADSTGTIGSAYLVGPRALLTAQHVVADRSADQSPAEYPSVEVRLLRDKGAPPGPWLPVRVAWESAQLDVALLELTGRVQTGVEGMAQWAAVEHDTAVYAIGFPLVEERPDGTRDTDKVTGEILYESGWIGGRLAFDVHSSTPVLPARGRDGERTRRSGWLGLSGAGLLAGDLLVGVVVTDHDPLLREGRRLEAVPVVKLLQDHGFCAAAQAVGLRPMPQALAVPMPRSPAEEAIERHAGPRVSPSVDYFLDRTKELASIQRFLHGGKQRVICITGGRGAGKSALASAALAPYEQAGEIDALVYTTGATTDLDFDIQTLLSRCLELLAPVHRKELTALVDAAAEKAIPDVLKVFQSRRLVILLDNVDAALAPDNHRRAGLIDLIDGICRSPASATVVTTSERLPLLPSSLSASRVDVPLESGLPPREALLLLRRLGQAGPESLRGCAADELMKLARSVLFLPRGLELSAAVLEMDPGLTVPDLIDSLQERDDITRELSPRAMNLLTDDDLLVLRAVAVLGDEATDDSVTSVTRSLQLTLPVKDALSRLCHLRLLARGSPANRLFFHPLDMEIALARTPSTLLEQLHAAAAEWFKTQRTDPSTWRTRASVDAQLNEARHYLLAGDAESAAQVLDFKVWDLLVWHGGSGIAAELLGELESVLLSPRSQLNVSFARADITHHGGSPLLAADLYREVAEQAGALGANDVQFLALDKSGNALRYVRRWDEAVGVLTQAADVSRDHLHGQGEGDILFHLALVHAYQRKLPELDAVLSRMEQIRQVDGVAAQPGRLENIRCASRMLARDFQGARDAATAAIAAFDATGRRDNAGFMYNARALSLMAQQAWEDAHADLRHALRRGREFEVPRLAGYAGINLTWLMLMQGQLPEAKTAGSAAHAELEKQGLPDAPIVDRLVQSIECLQLQQWDAAKVSLAQAVSATAGNLDLFTITPDEVTSLCVELGQRAS